MRPPLTLKLALSCASFLCLAAATAAPLPPSSVPDPLKTWVPWVMHGHEMLACPMAYNSEENRACIWPSRLELKATGRGAEFRFEVQVFGPAALVELPGEPGRWPQDLQANGRAVLATARDNQPVVQLSAGNHVVTGHLSWAEMPQDLRLPKVTGSLQLSVNGKAVNQVPDAEGRVWLQASQVQPQGSDAITVRTSRLVDDDIPMRVTTHYDIAVSGKPRAIELPSSLLPGFVAESLTSPLPARLQDKGLLRVQARPGNWTVEIRGRLMQPAATLALPAGLSEEIWSFAAHNELRMVTAEGLPSVDPKQVAIPDAWRSFPAYQIKAGQTLKLSESRRGNPQPGADQLTLSRQIWLDFDGQGYTMQDAIQGNLSRSWRLEMAAPGVLGRAAADGIDQPVTRRAGAPTDGVELRRGGLALSADSRIEGNARTLPGTGWMADFNAASAQLHLPPGWRLLHASGVDKAEASWVARWTLWDFFFVLLSTLAAAKLLGRKTGALVAGALILSWHMPHAPQGIWLALVGLLALTRVLPEGKLLSGATWGSRLCAGAIALWLVPYAVEQIRLSIHPALEHPWMQAADHAPTARNVAMPAAAPAPAPEATAERADAGAADQAAPAELLRESRSELKSFGSAVGRAKVASPARADASRIALNEIDPSVKVQTGPGLPSWQWNAHRLVWQGPVQAAQSFRLFLLPPAGTAIFRLGGLALMLAAWWALAAGLPAWARRPRSSEAEPAPSGPAMLWVALLIAGLGSGSPDAAAAEPEIATPDTSVLDELRSKLTAPPECLPQCADVARLQVEAQSARVQLRLEVHALAPTMVPLPGQGSNWRPTLITVNGQAAVVRRDAAGALWLAVPAGIHQVLLAADVGDASNVEIALPLPPREVTLRTEGWALAGLDPRGVASGALSLSRSAPGGPSGDSGTLKDALPAFLRVERTVHLGLRWTVETRISRLAPSRAPARARIALLEGETVNSELVRVENGHAVVQLGAEDSASFVSTLKESARLQLVSADQPQQIEQWRLDPSAQWHVGWSGIAPVHYTDQPGGRLMPSWQPWPGERITLDISKPAGSPGQTLTLDGLRLRLSPGLRATDVSSIASLRSSQGGNHRVQLPEGVEFLGLTLDGQSQPIQPQGRALLIPLTPGAHSVKVDWREPRGMDWWFKTTPYGLGAAGVNARTEIKLPPERVVLAVGGPRVGPAVLFWGVVVTLLGVAVGLARSQLTPLGVGAWFLLGVGLAQTSLLGAAIVGGWFFLLAVRRRLVLDARGGGAQLSRHLANLVQVLLVLWTLAAASFLLNAVRVGLLGVPDMMVIGNGSGASALHWYQDRFADQVESAWVVSAPVLAYRLLMLLWALWLAASLLKWVKWAWECFSAGGYWRKRESIATAEMVTPEPGPSPR